MLVMTESNKLPGQQWISGVKFFLDRIQSSDIADHPVELTIHAVLAVCLIAGAIYGATHAAHAILDQTFHLSCVYAVEIDTIIGKQQNPPFVRFLHDGD